MKSIDQLLEECESNKSCIKCSNYIDCIIKYKNVSYSEFNNPSTMNGEIRSFESDIYKDENTKENYRIDISEANQTIINNAMIYLNQMEDSTEKNLLKSALEKFSAEVSNSAEIFKSKDNKCHLVFECVDCMAINDSTEYANGDTITIHCKYCGKKHKFTLSKKE